MENSARLRQNVALEILACTVDDVRTLGQDSIAPVPMTIPESDVNTSMMPAKLVLAKTVPRVSTRVLGLLVYVHQDTQVTTKFQDPYLRSGVIE